MGLGRGVGGVYFLAIGLGFLCEGGDSVVFRVEIDDDDLAGFEVVRGKRRTADGGGYVVPAVIVERTLSAWGTEKLHDILPCGRARLDLCKARGQDNLTAGVDGFGAASDKGSCDGEWRHKGKNGERIMLFHWLTDYGNAKRRATVVVDSIFADARAASEAVFDADSRLEANQQAKFEYMCPWAALHLMEADGDKARDTLEALLDRIEIGLREGGVGDMTVGKRMRVYSAALHGRVRRYASLIERAEWAELEAALTEHGVAKTLVADLRGKRPA